MESDDESTFDTDLPVTALKALQCRSFKLKVAPGRAVWDAPYGWLHMLPSDTGRIENTVITESGELLCFATRTGPGRIYGWIPFNEVDLLPREPNLQSAGIDPTIPYRHYVGYTYEVLETTVSNSHPIEEGTRGLVIGVNRNADHEPLYCILISQPNHVREIEVLQDDLYMVSLHLPGGHFPDFRVPEVFIADSDDIERDRIVPDSQPEENLDEIIPITDPSSVPWGNGISLPPTGLPAQAYSNVSERQPSASESTVVSGSPARGSSQRMPSTPPRSAFRPVASTLQVPGQASNDPSRSLQGMLRPLSEMELDPPPSTPQVPSQAAPEGMSPTTPIPEFRPIYPGDVDDNMESQDLPAYLASVMQEATERRSPAPSSVAASMSGAMGGTANSPSMMRQVSAAQQSQSETTLDTGPTSSPAGGATPSRQEAVLPAWAEDAIEKPFKCIREVSLPSAVGGHPLDLKLGLIGRITAARPSQKSAAGVEFRVVTLLPVPTEGWVESEYIQIGPRKIRDHDFETDLPEPPLPDSVPKTVLDSRLTKLVNIVLQTCWDRGHVWNIDYQRLDAISTPEKRLRLSQKFSWGCYRAGQFDTLNNPNGFTLEQLVTQGPPPPTVKKMVMLPSGKREVQTVSVDWPTKKVGDLEAPYTKDAVFSFPCIYACAAWNFPEGKGGQSRPALYVGQTMSFGHRVNGHRHATINTRKPKEGHFYPMRRLAKENKTVAICKVQVEDEPLIRWLELIAMALTRSLSRHEEGNQDSSYPCRRDLRNLQSRHEEQAGLKGLLTDCLATNTSVPIREQIKSERRTWLRTDIENGQFAGWTLFRSEQRIVGTKAALYVHYAPLELKEALRADPYINFKLPADYNKKYKGWLCSFIFELAPPGQRHPDPWFNMPLFGPWSDYDIVHRLALRVEFRNPKQDASIPMIAGYWRYGVGGQMWLDGFRGLTLGYVYCSSMTRALFGQKLMHPFPWKLEFNPFRVRKVEFDYFLQKFSFPLDKPSRELVPHGELYSEEVVAQKLRALVDPQKTRVDPDRGIGRHFASKKKGKAKPRTACDACTDMDKPRPSHPFFPSKIKCVFDGNNKRCQSCMSLGYVCTWTFRDDLVRDDVPQYLLRQKPGEHHRLALQVRDVEFQPLYPHIDFTRGDVIAAMEEADEDDE